MMKIAAMAVDVAEPAADDEQRRERERVAGDDPQQRRQRRVEVGADRRDRDVQHGVVEHDDERGQDHDERARPSAADRDARVRDACGRCVADHFARRCFMRRSWAKSSGRPGQRGRLVGAQAVEDDPHEPLAQHGLQVARDRGRVRDAREQHRDVAGPDVGADRARGLGAGDELRHRAQHLRRGGPRPSRARSRSPSGRRARGGAPGTSGSPTTNRSNACAGSGSASAASPRSQQRLVHRADDRFDERLLGREVAAHRADPDPGAAGDLLDRRLQPRLREDRLGRGEHPLAIADGRRPAGGRSACVSSGIMIPIIVMIRNRDSTSGSRRRSRPPAVPRSHHGSRDPEPGRRRVRPPLVDARGALPEPADRLRRQLEPQRRHPHALARPARDRVAAAVGRRRLLARVRRPAVLDRRARRPLRAQGRAATRARAVPRRRRARVGVDRHGPAHRVPGDHGRRRRADHAVDAVDHHQRLPRARAPEGDRDLGERHRRGRRARSGRERLPARPLLVRVGLPRSTSRSSSVALVAGQVPRAEVARSRGVAVRPARRGPVDHRHRRARLRADRGARQGLDERRRRSSRSSVAVVVLALFVAWELHTARADARHALLPRPGVQHRHRRHDPRVRRDVRRDVPHHPVLPARARLQPRCRRRCASCRSR